LKKKIGILGICILVLTLLLGHEPLLRLYYRVDYQPFILREAYRHQISPHLIASVIFSESRFRAESKSDVGALGLMQLMPETATEMAQRENVAEFSLDQLSDPELNIRLGSRYLAELLRLFPSEEEALAAYNAGPTVVGAWKQQGKGIVFPETRAYVKNVQYHKARLERLYPHWKKGP
jgi:soluble lytic murein transglycosylase